MKYVNKVFLFSALLMISRFTGIAQSFTNTPAGDSLIATGEKPLMIANQFSFTEGASVDKKGNIFFTDQPNDKIWKYDINGKLSVFLDKAGRSNGMYFDQKGNLITCADEKDQLWAISPKGKIQVLLQNLDGHRFNGPNDLWITPKGGLYFTDPYYQRDYWDRTKTDLDGEKVYYMADETKPPVVVEDQLKKPNGIVGSPDGKYLLVADIGANKTYKYRINPDGTLTDKQLLITQGSDGMTIDGRGNIYLTGKGVTVYDPQGKKIAHIEIPEPWTANLCFGGKHKNLLFITASKAIYTLKMNVKGVE